LLVFPGMIALFVLCLFGFSSCQPTGHSKISSSWFISSLEYLIGNFFPNQEYNFFEFGVVLLFSMLIPVLIIFLFGLYCRSMYNQYKRNLARQEFEKELKLTTQKLEEVSQVKRIVCDVCTDEHGIYLDVGNGLRVYPKDGWAFSPLGVKSIPISDDRNRVGNKESIVPNSPLYKKTEMPRFQGQFCVGENVIGHFSRIRLGKRHCILTAFHVLEYNKDANITLRHGDRTVPFSSVKSKVHSFSPSEQLDFLILEVEEYVFSTLALAIASIKSQFVERTVVSINQLYDNEPCFSTAPVLVDKERPYLVKYLASTKPSSSGAPLLNVRNEIVGIHLGAGDNGYNVGSIPPVFRVKESPMNNDALAAFEARSYEDLINDLEDKYDDYNDRLQRLQDRDSYYTFKRSSEAKWTDVVEQAPMSDLDRFMVLGPDALQQHVLTERKKGRKESPWTCSSCLTTHFENSKYCLNQNCGKLRKELSEDEIKQCEAERAEILRSLDENKTFPPNLINKIMEAVDKRLNEFKDSLEFTKIWQDRDTVYDVAQEGVGKPCRPLCHTIPEIPVTTGAYRALGNDNWSMLSPRWGDRVYIPPNSHVIKYQCNCVNHGWRKNIPFAGVKEVIPTPGVKIDPENCNEGENDWYHYSSCGCIGNPPDVHVANRTVDVEPLTVINNDGKLDLLTGEVTEPSKTEKQEFDNKRKLIAAAEEDALIQLKLMLKGKARASKETLVPEEVVVKPSEVINEIPPETKTEKDAKLIKKARQDYARAAKQMQKLAKLYPEELEDLNHSLNLQSPVTAGVITINGQKQLSFQQNQTSSVIPQSSLKETKRSQ